jgi:hypothetical protein
VLCVLLWLVLLCVELVWPLRSLELLVEVLGGTALVELPVIGDVLLCELTSLELVVGGSELLVLEVLEAGGWLAVLDWLLGGSEDAPEVALVVELDALLGGCALVSDCGMDEPELPLLLQDEETSCTLLTVSVPPLPLPVEAVALAEVVLLCAEAVA